VTSRSPIQISPESRPRPGGISQERDLPQRRPDEDEKLAVLMSRGPRPPPSRCEGLRHFCEPDSASRRMYRHSAGDKTYSLRTGIDQPQDHFYAGAMKLGVEAALVDGLLVGRRRRRRRTRRRVGLAAPPAAESRCRASSIAGERLRRRGLPRRDADGTGAPAKRSSRPRHGVRSDLITTRSTS